MRYPRSDHHPDINERADKTAARQARVVRAAKRQSRVERAAYSASELAASINVADSTVFRWIAKGIVRAVPIAGKTFIPASERDRLLQEGAPSSRGKQARTSTGQFVKDGAVDKPAKRRRVPVAAE